MTIRTKLSEDFGEIGMGAFDSEGKQYFSQNEIFADAFNYLLYDGDEVIKPDELKELDATQIAIPYGNGARVPVQKYRDILKLWNAMMDDDAIYVILGAELQAGVHYAMPVKDGLYDMIGYSKQIEEAKRSYRKKNPVTDGADSADNTNDVSDLLVEGDALKLKLTSDEFLSGFRKGDKLMPIITAVIYTGPDPWDGPTSLFEMLDVKDKRLYPFLNDYKINLISPVDTDDADFDKFHTDFGFAMKVLKYQKDKAAEVIEERGHQEVDRGTAEFLNSVAKLGLEYKEEGDKIDMCRSMEDYKLKNQVTGAITGMRLMGASDSDIVKQIVEAFHVTKDYVLSLLAPVQAQA